MIFVRNEAVNLVDSVLDESIFVVNNQMNDSKIDSESEHFAITSDVSNNGIDFMKSPTIESMSGKSFDDNISAHSIHDSHEFDQMITFDPDNIEDEIIIPKTKTSRLDKKFERLSSEIENYETTDDDMHLKDYDQALKACVEKDEISNLQSDFSKISWDESYSATTADGGLNTPDNDLQEGDDEE